MIWLDTNIIKIIFCFLKVIFVLFLTVFSSAMLSIIERRLLAFFKIDMVLIELVGWEVYNYVLI